MTYQVVVPCVVARDHDGRSHHLYEGAVVEWLDEDQAKQWVQEGLVAKVGTTPSPTAEPTVDEVVDSPPPKVAPKADWVDYAVAMSDLSVEDAEQLTKHELIEQFGG